MEKSAYIVSVSSGASSAAALIRAYELYPHEHIYPVFADTNIEHEDHHRFLRDLENLLRIKIHRLNSGKTPYDISEEQGMIFNSRVANCTIELKVKPIQQYVETIRIMGGVQ